MEENEKKFRIRFYHIFFAVIGVALIWVCICYARRGVFYLDYEFLYKWGSKYVGKHTEIQMEQKKDAFYFTIKDRESKEQEEVVLRWYGDVSDVCKGYEITFDKDYVKKGTWMEVSERKFNRIYAPLGDDYYMEEDVGENQCRALCRIAAEKYEHLGNIWNGILGLCLYFIGTMCCIPYKGTVLVNPDMPKIKPNKKMRILVVLVGIGLIVYGIEVCCKDWLNLVSDRIWFSFISEYRF